MTLTLFSFKTQNTFEENKRMGINSTILLLRLFQKGKRITKIRISRGHLNQSYAVGKEMEKPSFGRVQHQDKFMFPHIES